MFFSPLLEITAVSERARRKPSSAVISSLSLNSIRHPFNTGRLSSCAQQNAVFATIFLKSPCFRTKLSSPTVRLISGNSSAEIACIYEPESRYLISTPRSPVVTHTSSPDSLPIKSVKSFPGTQTAPSSSTSALIVFSMESSPSVARSDTVSPLAPILIHSITGAVVLTAHALLTLSTASASERPFEVNFMRSLLLRGD